MTTTSVVEGRLPSGLRTVILENRHLAVTLLPDKGADIYSIQYKPLDDLNVLFRSPWAPRIPGSTTQPGSTEEQWLDHYHGGWQWMFPNAGDACKYKGASIGVHGEASVIPWAYSTDSNNDGDVSVIFETNLTRTPWSLQKRVSLSQDAPVMRIHDKVCNLGEEEMEFIWGQHIAFGQPFLNERCTVPLPGDRSFPIPSARERLADMSFITDLKEGWNVLNDAGTGLNADIRWNLSDFPYLWVWQEFRGTFGYPFHGRCYVMGLEPCNTPIGDGLAESVKQGFAVKVAPGESRETEISFALYRDEYREPGL